MLITITKKTFLFALFLLGSCSQILGANKTTTSIFDLMNHSEVLEVTLETDLNHFVANRRDIEKHTSRITFEDAQGKLQEWEVGVSLRGRFRRMNCAVPPLKLDFKKSELKKNDLAKFDDLKLVTHCSEDKAEAKELLLKEYLAYRLYNQITDDSYRVQLVKITYIDAETQEKTKNWAIIIEDTAQLRDRINAEKVETYGVQTEAFSVEAVQQVAVFQYLIGNGDWKLNVGHNLKMVKRNGEVIPVPYDFDFSGLVNAPYAIPNSNWGQLSLQDRVMPDLPNRFRDFHNIIYSFQGKSKDLLDIVNDFKLLNRTKRKECVEFLQSYLSNVEDIQIASSDNQIGMAP